MRGLLVVIEGIDGSGKTTQVNLLSKSLKEKGIGHEVMNFPRYGKNPYADLVKRYLDGEFGRGVDPYLIALAFAGDRVLAKPQIEQWLSQGKMVLANRYVSSSKAHLASNLPPDERRKFIKWLDELEYKINGMPKEDLVILLNVNAEASQQNIPQAKLDIHEESLKHLEEANKIYLELAKEEPNWYVVNCTSDGQMRPKVKIHQQILQILSKKFPS